MVQGEATVSVEIMLSRTKHSRYSTPPTSLRLGKSYLPRVYEGTAQHGQMPMSVSSLMTTTEMVLAALVYSPLNHKILLVAQEYFTEFSRHESFKSYG